MGSKLAAAAGISEPIVKKGILYISCGVPGSGKSTFLKSHVGKDEAIISRDEIRFSLVREDEEYFSHEDEVFKTFINIITEHINSGINTYADATHLNKRGREKLTDALLEAGCQPSEVKAIFFDVPVPVCIERNEKRKGTRSYVPKSVIRRMYSQRELPIGEFKTTYIVNQDGVISKYGV